LGQDAKSALAQACVTVSSAFFIVNSKLGAKMPSCNAIENQQSNSQYQKESQAWSLGHSKETFRESNISDFDCLLAPDY